MRPLRFRPAESNDLHRVAALVNAAYRGDVSRQGWTTEADLLDGQRTDPETLRTMIGEDAAGREQRIELAFDTGPDSNLVACFYLRKETAETAYIGMVTVDPTLQAAGLGKLLLERAEALARDWSCTRMRMTVIDRRESLLAYYFRRGYSLTGASEPFPGDPKFGVPKLPDLKLLELVKPLAHGAR